MTHTTRWTALAVATFLALPALPAAAQQRGGSAASTAGMQSGTVSGATGQPSTTQAVSAASSGDTAVENRFALGDELTLRQCFEAALAGSRTLLLSKERLLSAENDIRRGWSAVKPSVYVRGSLTRYDKSISFGGGQTVRPLWDYSASGTLTETIFNGQSIPALQALHALRDATELNNEQTRTDVLYAVASVFYSTLALQQGVDVAKRQVEDTTAHYEATKARFDVGEVSKVDLLRAEIDRSTAEEDLVAAKSGYESSKIALAILVGRPTDAGPFTLAEPKAPDLEKLKAPEAVKSALQNRPDLAAANKQVLASQHYVTAAWLAFLPTLDFSFNTNYQQATVFSDAFSWSATLNLTIPIYDAGQRYVAIQAANIQERQAQLAVDGLKDTIRKDVLQARLDMQTAAANLQKAQDTARLAVENADLVKARFDAGLATSLDVTDASTTRFQAEVDVVRQRLNLQLSMLSLARSMGILSEAAQLAPPTE